MVSLRLCNVQFVREVSSPTSRLTWLDSDCAPQLSVHRNARRWRRGFPCHQRSFNHSHMHSGATPSAGVRRGHTTPKTEGRLTASFLLVVPAAYLKLRRLYSAVTQLITFTAAIYDQPKYLSTPSSPALQHRTRAPRSRVSRVMAAVICARP